MKGAWCMHYTGGVATGRPLYIIIVYCTATRQQAALCALTSQTIADCVIAQGGCEELLVCGGGAFVFFGFFLVLQPRGCTRDLCRTLRSRGSIRCRCRPERAQACLAQRYTSSIYITAKPFPSAWLATPFPVWCHLQRLHGSPSTSLSA